MPRGKRGGGIQRRKNGSIVIDMKDSNKDSAAYMKHAAAIAGQAFYAAGYNKLFTEPIELGARFYFKRPMAHCGTGANAGCPFSRRANEYPMPGDSIEPHWQSVPSKAFDR